MYDLVRRLDISTLVQYVAATLTYNTLRHGEHISLAIKELP
jgi:hypothetical protein